MDLLKSIFKGDKVICVIGPQWSPLLYVSVDAAENTSIIEMRQRQRKIIQITLSPLNMFFNKSNLIAIKN